MKVTKDDPSGNEAKDPNRRKALQAFCLATLSATAGSALSGREEKTRAGSRLVPNVYGTVAEMARDTTLTEGAYARTAGYHVVGDGGGAEFIITRPTPQVAAGVIALNHNLVAVLTNVASVNYRMFGAKGDGKSDDGMQIKLAHAYANHLDLPVINQKGEYWIKATNAIEIMTNVQWGDTIFHLDEKFNSATTSRFLVLGREKPVTIEFDGPTKAKVLAQVKPGVTVIPELAAFKNSLVVMSDANDRIGVRSGAVYGGRSTRAREEFFFVEEHGRLLGDVAWGFNDYTSIVSYPGSNSYLVIEGGTFYLSGEKTTAGGSRYVHTGFAINRSRTIIRNQWVGLEKGRADLAMAPRRGFYSFSYVYDVLLENVRLTPWEKDRPGTADDVPNGTYGLSGNHALNATFRNVTAEGSPIHWGVFGTNLFKNFRVEHCALNRIDVHFYCWNLYIKDSAIGTNGITVTGGGDLFIENTSCRANSFVSFRRDYGAKWDGDIRIRNCRHAPTGRGETALLSMAADDFDYKYPIGYGRTIKVEDMVVDFSAVPASTGICWLLRTSRFSRATHGQRVFFPSQVEFRNIAVTGREQGVRLVQLPNPQWFKLAKAGGYDGIRLRPNCRMIFENIQLEKLAAPESPSMAPAHFVLRTTGENQPGDEHGLYPEIRIARCHEFAGHFGGNIADVFLEQCKIVGITGKESGAMPGALTFSHCQFEANAKESGSPCYLVASELGTSFINCVIHAPQVDNISRPEFIDQVGFVKMNAAVHYNHINTRLGNEVVSYYRSKGLSIDAKFIAMLKSHHELEPAII